MKNPERSLQKTALLLRVNAWHELLGTHDLPEVIRQRFHVEKIVTIATPQTDTLSLLQNDPKLDEVILFPKDSQQPKTLKNWISTTKAINSKVCVLAFHDEVPEKCGRHIVSLLLCKGKKYFYVSTKGFFSLDSVKGWKLLIGVVLQQILRKVKLRWTRYVYEKRPNAYLTLPHYPVKKILWMRPDLLGDVIMTLPTLEVLKQHFPDAQIDALVRSQSAKMLKDIPDFYRIIECNIAPYSNPMKKRSFAALKMDLKKQHYDLAIDFRGDDILRQLATQLKIPIRIGPRAGSEYEVFENYSFYMTHCIDLPADNLHYVEQNLALLEKAGLLANGNPYTFPVTPQATERVNAVLNTHSVASPFAVIHTHSLNRSKDWLPERFAEVAKHLIERYKLRIILNGSKDDYDYNEQIVKLINLPDVHNASGWLALPDLPALFQNAAIMVTVDSGPMHMAAAVGTPIVALVLPGYFDRIFPYRQRENTLTVQEKEIAALVNSGKFEGRVLDAISVEDVTKVIDRLLSARKS